MDLIRETWHTRRRADVKIRCVQCDRPIVIGEKYHSLTYRDDIINTVATCQKCETLIKQILDVGAGDAIRDPDTDHGIYSFYEHSQWIAEELEALGHQALADALRHRFDWKKAAK